MIVQVDQVSSQLVDSTLSGIMGLAFNTIASTQSTPFWQALSEGGQLSTKEMSFWLTRATGVPTQQEDTQPGGVFTLGGTNSSLFSGDIDFQNMPGTSQTFWLLTLSGKFNLVGAITLILWLTFSGSCHCPRSTSSNNGWEYRSVCDRYRHHSHRRAFG